jgi:hypothetical protein
MTVNSPGVTKVITPAQIHINLDKLSSVGMFPNSTVGAPGTHGAGVFGTQGMGVNTPKAAAVADATSGLAIDMHIPNGMMFSIGTWSMILASGTWLVNVLFTGNTTSELGAAPKLHIIEAPMQTCIAISRYLQPFGCFFILTNFRQGIGQLHVT